ncbi:hypothetical protein ABT075_16005 [Streptomyces sp. NPDC002677]|uniref:hypothetical protein n=1 Tax=Streptomyces sp. NPDC002677 TaxID=3154774 RepID=UPI00332AC8CF
MPTSPTRTVLRRPAFWDGGRGGKVRFASPGTDGRWTWRSGSSVPDEGLAGQGGALVVRPAADDGDAFHRHGF